MRFILPLLLAAAQAQEKEPTGIPGMYDGLVMGLGPGTLAVCIAAVIGTIFCFFRNIMPIPSIMIIIGFALPIFVLIIVLLIPKRPLEINENEPTDNFHVQVIGFSLFIYLACLC